MESSGTQPHDWREWRRIRAWDLAQQGWAQRDIAVGLVAMRVDPRTHSAGELDEFLKAFDFPLVAHLRQTQVYVHCARDGLSVFDLPRSRAEQDWEQWRPLTRWISKQGAAKAA